MGTYCVECGEKLSVGSTPKCCKKGVYCNSCVERLRTRLFSDKVIGKMAADLRAKCKVSQATTMELRRQLDSVPKCPECKEPMDRAKWADYWETC